MIREKDVFGKWTVISEEFSTGHGLAVLCRCRCGNVRRVVCSELRSKRSTSCGCVSARLTHGHTAGRTHSLTYSSWQAMKDRCLDPTHKWFCNYGAVGVTVCDRWINSFDTFLEDVGERPSPDHSIDRIENSKGYEPGNCRWATRAVQRRNSKRIVSVTIEGQTKCLTDWCKETGVKFGTAYDRIVRGWDPVRAVLEPAR